MNAAALALLLSVAPRPAADGRLSSWLSRIARIYDLSASGLLAQFGVAADRRRRSKSGFWQGRGT